MGLFEKIKAWFRPKSQVSTPSSPSLRLSAPPLQREVSSSEGEMLVREHEQLETERTRLRQEITVVDRQYANGEMGAGDRDRAYRMRLARAGRISMRQLEIRSTLVKIGHPIPVEWGAIQIRR